jgi:hypothetical protein
MSTEPMKVTDRRAMTVLVDEPQQQIAIVASPYMRTIDMMLQRGAEIGALERLFDLQVAWEKNEARKAYAKALAAMKATIPIEVFKRKKVDVPGGAKFKHAELCDVVDAAVEAMGKFGFVHSWKPTAQTSEYLEITCIITHELGHKEETTLRSDYDSSNPKMSSLHRLGSTVTYLERYTLVAALGVAAKNIDDDGASAGKNPADVPEAPVGYKDWRADMTATADEGLQRLTDTWSKSNGDFRRHVIKADEAWWAETKAKAVQADKKAKQS